MKPIQLGLFLGRDLAYPGTYILYRLVFYTRYDPQENFFAHQWFHVFVISAANTSHFGGLGATRLIELPILHRVVARTKPMARLHIERLTNHNDSGLISDTPLNDSRLTSDWSLADGWAPPP